MKGSSTVSRLNCFITVRNSSCGKVMSSQGGCMHGEGGMYGEGGYMCGEGGACMVKGGMCGKEGVHGKGGACMGGGGHVWQERRPLQWTVRILLECILVLQIFLDLPSPEPKPGIANNALEEDEIGKKKTVGVSRGYTDHHQGRGHP